MLDCSFRIAIQTVPLLNKGHLLAKVQNTWCLGVDVTPPLVWISVHLHHTTYSLTRSTVRSQNVFFESSMPQHPTPSTLNLQLSVPTSVVERNYYRRDEKEKIHKPKLTTNFFNKIFYFKFSSVKTLTSLDKNTDEAVNGSIQHSYPSLYSTSSSWVQ